MVNITTLPKNCLIVMSVLATSAWAFDGGGVTERVRHELATLSYHGVFDHITLELDESRVILRGQVTRPTLRSDAERVAARVEGVSEVVNEIEVLPLSSFDDQIRLAVSRAIYSQPWLTRYAIQPVPTIRIVVKNGAVTLEGTVGSEADGKIAEMMANGVGGVFSVANNLQVETERPAPPNSI